MEQKFYYETKLTVVKGYQNNYDYPVVVKSSLDNNVGVIKAAQLALKETKKQYPGHEVVIRSVEWVNADSLFDHKTGREKTDDRTS